MKELTINNVNELHIPVRRNGEYQLLHATVDNNGDLQTYKFFNITKKEYYTIKLGEHFQKHQNVYLGILEISLNALLYKGGSVLWTEGRKLLRK